MPFIIVCTFCLGVVIPFPAHAYLDPGTGSMILQLLFGGAVGALAFAKLFWAKIFHRNPPPTDDADSAENLTDDHRS